jgi:hypothetical protein
MLTIYNLIGTFFVCGFQLNNKSLYYTCLNTISGSSNLDICCYHCLILRSISHLKALFIIIIVVVVVIIVTIVVVLLLFIIYTINLPVVRPRFCRVIYYFDTPTLGKRHQSFGRVTEKGAKSIPSIMNGENTCRSIFPANNIIPLII